MSAYVAELRRNASGPANAESTNLGPASKKRKVDEGPSLGDLKVESGAWNDINTKPAYSAGQVSFAAPERGKLDLQIIGGTGGGLRASKLTGGSAAGYEFGLPWMAIDQVFCLPVPEKQKRAWNYVVIPKGNNGIAAAEPGAPEQIVWMYQELSAKEAAASDAPTEPDHTAGLLDKHLTPLGKSVVMPEESEFASAIPESHRKGEKAYHVKAFRGSKEGFLFFLPVGILWAFKKPLTFFAFGSIESISYTSVLQRTFNLVIATNPLADGEAGQEIEFSMLDQADFAGIDTYVKAHGLNDASLAKQRAAKLYHVNKDKGAKGAGGATNGEAEGGGQEEAGEDDGMTEIQRAEQQLQDEEDEMEEDYDPDASDDDEGSSEDEGYGDGEVTGTQEVAVDEGGDAAKEEEYEEGDEEEEEYDEEEEVAEEVVPVTAAASGFATINGHVPVREQLPEEPEDGFL
ncbi:MAG: hypothetical protein INR71_11710 [Terriglobus roseus]|nr:hypothetical protein [Terriglobus roseus]